MSNYTKNQLADDPNHAWSKLLAFIPENSEVLDVGCSSGTFGKELQTRKHCVVDGVEPDVADARLAAKKLREVWTFSIEDEASVKKIHKTYDVIIFADVLEHLVNPAKTLRSLKRLLKNSGSIVFSVPNMAHISVRLSLLGGTFEYTDVGLLDKTHLHFYDLDAVYSLFRDAGMKLEQLDASSFEYPDELIKKRLDSLGFKLTPEGRALLHTPEAAAFQYVGRATFTSGTSAKLKPTTQAVAKDVQMLQQEVVTKQEVIDHLNEDIRVLKQHVEDISGQLKHLATSKAYRLGNVLVRPVRAVRSIKKKGKHVH